MRIIAGKYRGRTIKSVSGLKTRPTLDQVKEAVFNTLGQFFDGGMVLDLYAGSGNLGLEAMSRGCEKAIFVDQSYQAIQVIKENIKILKLENETEVYKMNALLALKRLMTDSVQFDFIFLDPPYEGHELNDVISKIVEGDLIKEDGYIICETLKKTELIDGYKQLTKIKEANYGISKITIYKREGA